MKLQCKLCSSKNYEIQEVLSLAILGGLPTASHSLGLSHNWPTQRLLAAGFPLWPSPPRLRQPDPPWLPAEVHVYAGLSAYAGSTWTDGLKPVHFFRAKESLLIRCISCVCLSRSPVILVFIITTLHRLFEWQREDKTRLKSSIVIRKWHEHSPPLTSIMHLSCSHLGQF